MKRKAQVDALDKILFWMVLIFAIVYLIWLVVKFLGYF